MIGVFKRNGKRKKKKSKDEDEEFVPILPDTYEYIGDSDPVDVTYEQAYSLYEMLNDKEREFLAPHGNYVDSPNLLLRKGYVDDDVCYAFCDVYKFKDDIDTGVLTVAVNPRARGEGLGYHAAKAAIEAATKFGISNFVYRVDKKNEPSIGLAKKLGGQLASEDEKMYKFKIL